ncbi:MAG TPA: hypothetical protein VMU26_01595 [Candidatus Polarisedimenticolia bacterium]|nr:hypothetical protein [Candidatus Polarisedimenticolia bacterium]
MTRTLYRWLICWHPPAFRLRFEEELLWIFDESSDASGAALFLYDAAISLLRQWLLRSGMWKWVLGGIAGALPVVIGFGSFIFDCPMHP